MRILEENDYILECWKCETKIIYTYKDCDFDSRYCSYELCCPNCHNRYSSTRNELFGKKYKENEFNSNEKEIERLNKELQDTKEHLGEYLHEQEEENKKLNNIINGMEKFFKYAYDNEVRPLNDRKVSVWTICLDKLQELKGGE